MAVKADTHRNPRNKDSASFGQYRRGREPDKKYRPILRLSPFLAYPTAVAYNSPLNCWPQTG